MKSMSSLFVLSLVLATGTVPAQDPPPKATGQQDQMDHSNMDMASKKPVDHRKMAADEFANLDSNKDGKLDKAEIPAEGPLADHFGMLDADKDGSLSKTEFAKHHEM